MLCTSTLFPQRRGSALVGSLSSKALVKNDRQVL